MTSVRRPALVTLLVAMMATLLVTITPPPAADAAQPRPWPALWDVVPATGEVVAAGPVRLAGTATAPSGIASVEVRLDGAVVPHEIADQNATAARVHAPVDVAVGEHVASIRYTANDGTPTERTWRFAATAVAARRLAGDDRYATAAAIAAEGREAGAAAHAVLARGDDHADALAGVPLAHALDGPLLLTEPDGLTDVTADALRQLVRPGGTVHLLGGTAALQTQVVADVQALGFRVARHDGENRHATAAAIARQLPDFTSAVVASGTSFPDALAAAAPAAIDGRPILLTDRGSLPAATRQVLAGLDRVTVVGGPAVVSQDVVDEIDAVAGQVTRIAGEDRYETAVRVVEHADLDTTTLGLASGETFPDALVGALDAARQGTGLVLTSSRRLPQITRALVRNLAPTTLRVYGGSVAVDPGVVSEARAARSDRGTRVTSEIPAPTDEIHSLDQLTLAFADDIDLSKSNLSVLFDGRELPTQVGTGDFPSTVVLTVGALTIEPRLGDTFPVRLVGVVHDGTGWTHVDRTWTFRKVAVSSGDEGDEVLQIQERLMALGYWLGSPDGAYGSLTVQAVMAFQKYEGLPITGTADATTQARLAAASRPVPADGGGYHIEVDKTRQLVMFAEDGRTIWTFNTSTGSEIPYDEEGGSGTAVTPTGNFTVCYERDYLRESSLGTLWRPKYFECQRGIAIHGATSVPGYPASHGCVRVTYPAMNFIWDQDLMPMGARLIVYGAIPG